MKDKKEKMVCAVCGGENINEERLLSVSVNCRTIIDDYYIDNYCEDCGEVVDIITEQEYQTKLKIDTSKFL